MNVKKVGREISLLAGGLCIINFRSSNETFYALLVENLVVGFKAV